MRKDLKQKYEECNICQDNQTPKAQAHNEISNEDIFKNFLLGQRLEVDYTERGNQNYLMIVCVLTGFIQEYKTANTSTSEVSENMGSELGIAILRQIRFRTSL